MDKENTTPLTAVLLTVWQWLCRYPAFAGALVTVVGGLVLLTWLLPLGFIPDFDLTTSLGLLVLAALLGTLLIATFGTILLAPVLITRRLAGNHYDRLWKSNARCCAFALVAVLFWFVVFWWNVTRDQTWIFWLFAVVLCCTALSAALTQWISTTPRWVNWHWWYGFCLLLVMQYLSFFIAFVLFVPGAQKGLSHISDGQQWLILAAWCVFVGLSNIVLLRAKNMTLGIVSTWGVVIVFALITLTRSFSYLYAMPVERLQLGNVRDVTLTVSTPAASVLHAACQIAEAPLACAQQPVTRDRETVGYAYQNVTILSRLGNQYYLQLCQPGEQVAPCVMDQGLRVVIDKKDVFGWSTQGKPKVVQH